MKQTYSLLLKGTGPARNGQETDADIALVKLFNDLRSTGHEIESVSIVCGGEVLPIHGPAVPHEVPELLSKPIEEIPSELKKLDKKELTALALALRKELDALKSSVGKAIEEAEKPGVVEDKTKDDDDEGDGSPGDV